MNRLFAEITAAPAAIETSRNKALIDEIKPWLMQFHLLGKAGQKAIRTAETGQGEDRAATWQSYLSLTSLLDSMRTIDRTQQSESVSERRESRLTSPTPFVQEIHSGVGSNLLFADQTDAATQMSKASILTDIEQLKYQPLKGRQRPDRIQPPERSTAYRAGTVLRPYLGIAERGHLLQLQPAEKRKQRTGIRMVRRRQTMDDYRRHPRRPGPLQIGKARSRSTLYPYA